MAYPGNFLRLVVSGELPGGEGYSWGLNFHGNFSTPDAPDEVPPAVIAALTTFHQEGVPTFSSGVVMREIKLNLIGPDGRYVSPSETVSHLFEPGVEGSGDTKLPNQCALAVTLRTGVKRGLANSGRFYLPCLKDMSLYDGQIGDGPAQYVAMGVNTLLNSLNAALDPWRLSVISNVRDGAVRPVTHVQVGRVIDTLRSRRTSIPEAYVTGAPLEP